MQMSAKQAVLLLPLVLILAGCVEEDTITITGDGVVHFESLVTVSDEAHKTSFADIDKGVADLVAELEKIRWKVERKWVSEKRPYAFQIKGSGNLREVGSSTKFYTLAPVMAGFYRVFFLTPQGEDGNPIRRRIVFPASPGTPNAEVHDAAGHLVTQIDTVLPEDPYSIRLRQ